ncbi:MAG: NAD(+) synthase [Muribaculaceae bacterium]|nr:NAD(+) synthase [Muribaculaceae bacterium]
MIRNFLRVAAVSPRVFLADVEANVKTIANIVAQLDKEGVDIAVFPELSLTGYTCADLFQNSALIEAARSGVVALADMTAGCSTAFTVGVPLVIDGKLYNCAVTIQKGQLVAVNGKKNIPNYGEFYEKRWFEPFKFEYIDVQFPGYDDEVPGGDILLQYGRAKIGIEICEDLWTPIPPSSRQALAGANVLLNLSASDSVAGKFDYLKNLIAQQSGRTVAAYVYASAGYGESTTDLVFDGKTIIAENGNIININQPWQLDSQWVISDIDIDALDHDRMTRSSFETDIADFGVIGLEVRDAMSDNEPLRRFIDPMPFVPKGDALDQRCFEIVNIQALGLARRLDATNTKTVVIGVSGGLDSTLALLVATRTFDILGLDRKGIVGVTMPGFGTTGRTHDNAVGLMKALGITHREISIVPAVNQHFKDIEHDPTIHDTTYENAQARQRTYLLMDLANKAGGMVVGTGDLSELALGWATYNGDQMSMYGVNAGVPKTLIRSLVLYFAGQSDDATRNILLDVADTPISPELIPADSQGNITQKTEDLVGPYELHDFFIYHFMRWGRTPNEIYLLACQAFDGRYDGVTILKWLGTFTHRFFSQQFKRSCMPDGPKVGSVTLSPRGDWRMPSDASVRVWMKYLDRRTGGDNRD